MTTVRLYGFTRGYGSYAQVLRGFQHALRERGYGPERLAVVPLDGAEPDASYELAQADVGIFLGPPSASSAMSQNAAHRLRFVMVAPNSSLLPEQTMKIVNAHATHVIVPSEWSAGVASRYSELPVMVVPHGVLPEFERTRGLREPTLSLEAELLGGQFRVLHLSSSSRDRKGTMKLVKAWARLRSLGALGKEPRLMLVLVPDTRVQVIEWLVEQKLDYKALGIIIKNRFGAHSEGASPAELREIYEGAHLVCQPSRAESFGMTPCEALACGTPIVATRATGHGQWFSSGLLGAVPVKVGPYDEIDDLPGARAPRIYSKWIAEALEFAYREWPRLKAEAVSHADHFAALWSWEEQLHNFIRYIEEKGSVP